MKTAVRMTVVALATVGTVSAFAQVGDRWEPSAAAVTSNLTRAEVQAEAVKASQERLARGYINESGNYVVQESAPATATALSREDVRAQITRGDLVTDPYFSRG